jgi:UDP-3-O-[3-hydroxymyristoyl] glucosamine N-acyltransferase
MVGPDAKVDGVATLEEAGPTQLSLCTNRRHTGRLRTTHAAGVILPSRAQAMAREAPCTVLLVEQPRLALARVLKLFFPAERVQAGVADGALVDGRACLHTTARIDAGARVEPGATVGARTWVEAGAFIGSGASVGEDCRIGPNAVVGGRCTLGDRVVLGPATVVGSTGFGFVWDGSTHHRIPQVGSVKVGDDVEIGAGTTVDLGTLGATCIGAGTKIDNLVQVGHNVVIGKNVVIAAQVGLSGSVRVEDGAVLGGQVGVADHVVIGAGAQVGAKSGVGTNVPAGARVAGYPAMPVQRWLESAFLWRRVRRLLKMRRGEGE